MEWYVCRIMYASGGVGLGIQMVYWCGFLGKCYPPLHRGIGLWLWRVWLDTRVLCSPKPYAQLPDPLPPARRSEYYGDPDLQYRLFYT